MLSAKDIVVNSAIQPLLIGDPNNVFGQNSGQQIINSVTIAPDKATAESTRDSYGVANPSWLASYDNNQNRYIILYYQDGSDYKIEYQIRVGSTWVINESIQAVQGERGVDGSRINFSSVTARDNFFTLNKDVLEDGLVILVNNEDGSASIQEWQGEDNPSVYENIFWSLPSFRTGLSSIELDKNLSISSGASRVFLRNNLSKTNSCAVAGALGYHHGASDRTVKLASAAVYGSYEEREPLGVALGVGEVDYISPTEFTTFNASVFGLDLVLAENINETLVYTAKSTGVEEIEVFKVTLEDINLNIDDILFVPFKSPFDGKIGDSAVGELSKLDGTIVKVRPSTDDPLKPYRKLKLREYEDKEIALREELPICAVGAELFQDMDETSCGSSWTYKINGTTQVKPAGTYKIEFACEVTQTGSRQEIRFLVDGQPIHNHDSGNDELEPEVDDENWTTLYGKYFLTLTSQSAISVAIQHKDSGTGKMSNATIEVRRFC